MPPLATQLNTPGVPRETRGLYNFDQRFAVTCGSARTARAESAVISYSVSRPARRGAGGCTNEPRDDDHWARSDMEPDSSQVNPAARLRLIDLRVAADRPNVHFGGRLSAILTEPGSRDGAARAIAVTVAGPRPDDADGSVEVAGELVSVRTLPSPLVPAGDPILIDTPGLGAHWQAWCARRRDALAVAHASGPGG